MVNNAWSDLGSWYNNNKGFIREVSKNNQPLSDKTVYHHKYITRTIVTLNNKFKVSFSATDLKPIRIAPSENWFDYQLFKTK
eukprot:EC819317.1.p1 GENE.EC819317.1~~EC819317.1.p1  ORF type:complete len:82 (+),score=33.39 EC819317.1:58-303(+)